MILAGSLAIVAGILALAWPGITVLVLVIMFAVWAFSDAALQAMRAFRSAAVGPVLGHLLLGLIDLGAGIVALAWPLPTALVLVLIVGIWAIAAGESTGTRALFLLGGLVSIAFGLVLLARPDVGAVTLALLYGLFAFSFGITQIAGGVSLHSARKDAEAILGPGA